MHACKKERSGNVQDFFALMNLTKEQVSRHNVRQNSFKG